MAQDNRDGVWRRRAVLRWFDQHGRDFPWRTTGQCFWPALVTEMLLRRTRASQVAAALPAVLDRFPTPDSMACTDETGVQEALGGLGLRWRASNLHATARRLAHSGRKEVLDRAELLELPGVGPYVADAVRAIAANDDVVLTDTNSVRVATRVHGMNITGDGRRRSDVQLAIHDLFGGPAPAKVWWGLIDLAHGVCTVRKPACDDCPLQRRCETGQKNRLVS